MDNYQQWGWPQSVEVNFTSCNPPEKGQVYLDEAGNEWHLRGELKQAPVLGEPGKTYYRFTIGTMPKHPVTLPPKFRKP